MTSGGCRRPRGRESGYEKVNWARAVVASAVLSRNFRGFSAETADSTASLDETRNAAPLFGGLASVPASGLDETELVPPGLLK